MIQLGLQMSFTILLTTTTQITTRCGGFLSTQSMMEVTGQMQIFFTEDMRILTL